MNQSIGKWVGAAATAALLLGASSVAFAQVIYDTGAPASGSAGSVVPNPNGSTVGASANTGTTNVNTTTTPGVPNTGGTGTTGATNTTTPGIPNTGAGDPATWGVMLTAILAALAGGAFLLYQRMAPNA
jgi:hypothetical protein